ncbi:low molecular weight protein-tyrosine-phosphatase [Microbacterium ginsengiterrae]
MQNATPPTRIRLCSDGIERQNGRVSPTDPFRVMFVCTGNICRSPMAEVVFRDLAEHQGVGPLIVSRSAGTGEWHVGERADVRTLEALERRGYDGTAHRAKQFTAASFAENDLIVALDRTHERILRQWARDEDDEGKVTLLLAFDRFAEGLDVPDPYYADTAMFDAVLAMIETATRGLFRQLEPALRQGRRTPRTPRI